MFARLRSWLNTALNLAPSEQVPTDAYAALIDDIYSAPMSFTIGAVTASVVDCVSRRCCSHSGCLLIRATRSLS